MSTWKNIWVYGYRTALEAFIEGKKIADEQTGGKHLPHEIFMTEPTYPQEQDGVNEFGNPSYRRKGGNPKVLWLFSLKGDADTLIDELKVLQGPYDVHENVTIEDIRILYPDFALGQGIPYIC